MEDRPQEPRTAGRVSSLHRYPLKSADGEVLDAVDVGPAGLAEDRRWAVARQDGTPLTAREAPGLRGLRARAVGGVLEVEPSISDVITEPFELVDAPGEHQQVASVHLVSEGAVSADDAPSGCDPFPRANVVLALDTPGAERSWNGHRVRLGDVELHVTRTPARCLGVYAEVVRPGRVRVGDPVELLD
jgi:uncharacterized protein YcbX